MRILKVLLLAPLLVLTACDQKKSDTAGAGVASATYDTSADANKRFLADYAAKPGVTKLPDGLMYRVLKAGNGPQLQKESDLVTV